VHRPSSIATSATGTVTLLRGAVWLKTGTHTALCSKPGNDPFTAFESGLGVSHSVSCVRPALLYVLNSDGLPVNARPSDPSAPATRKFQAQFDIIQQKVETGSRAFEVLAEQQERLSQQLQDNACVPPPPSLDYLLSSQALLA
jgi:hypothetical protein